MRRPFVLRVQADDPAVARAIARALVAPLCERGARVMLEGQTQGGGAEFGVHVMTAASGASEDQDAPLRVVTGDRGGVPGVALRIGVWDEEEGAKWLAPLDLPSDPQLAVERSMHFLQTWGFVGAVRARAKTA